MLLFFSYSSISLYIYHLSHLPSSPASSSKYGNPEIAFGLLAVGGGLDVDFDPDLVSVPERIHDGALDSVEMQEEEEFLFDGAGDDAQVGAEDGMAD